MKICIERSDRMGDMILTLPVIQGIKVKNPEAVIHVVSSKKNTKICSQFSYVDKVYEKSTSSSGYYNLMKTLRNENFDYYFSFSPSWFGLVLGLLSKSKITSSLILQSRYKSNFLSKFFKILFSKIFFSNSNIVNRYKEIKNNKNIHQTKMMMDAVIEAGVNIVFDTKVSSIFSNIQKLQKIRPICLIHLSSKWINQYYSEENFDNFLNLIQQKELTICLTTDETTKTKFSKIYNKYTVYDNWNNFVKSKEKIVICNEFNFEEWTTLINQSDYVITPECGCVHISSLTDCKLCIIYQTQISKKYYEEYTPWKKEFVGLETNDKKLNQKMLNFIQ